MIKDLVFQLVNWYSLNINPNYGTDMDLEVLEASLDSIMASCLNLLVNIGTCLDSVLGYELANYYWEFCFDNMLHLFM